MGKARTAPRALQLRLYIAGNAPNSVRAIANTRLVCNEHYPSCHELEIIDLLEFPLRALEDGIIVTPTLLRIYPKPVRRLIGNLSDLAAVLETLGAA